MYAWSAKSNVYFAQDPWWTDGGRGGAAANANPHRLSYRIQERFFRSRSASTPVAENTIDRLIRDAKKAEKTN